MIKGGVYGVTFIELLCVMACLAVLIGLSAISWYNASAKMHRTQLMQRVRSAVEFARSQAISTQMPVIYCGSSDLKHCDGQWSQGQIIRMAKRRKILQAYSGLNAVRILFHANFGRNQQIEFLTTGFTKGQDGRFDFCVKTLSAESCESLVLHFSGQLIISDKSFGYKKLI